MSWELGRVLTCWSVWSTAGRTSSPPNPRLFSICQQSHEAKVERLHLPISFQLIELWYPGNLGRKGETALGHGLRWRWTERKTLPEAAYSLSNIPYPLYLIHYTLSIIHYPVYLIHYTLSIIHYPYPLYSISMLHVDNVGYKHWCDMKQNVRSDLYFHSASEKKWQIRPPLRKWHKTPFLDGKSLMAHLVCKQSSPKSIFCIDNSPSDDALQPRLSPKYNNVVMRPLPNILIV